MAQPAPSPSSTCIRVWLKPRGTTKITPHLTSVLVPKDCLVDDLKWYIKEEMKPLLARFPKPAIQVYSYNHSADDYIFQKPTKMVATNPNPEVLPDTPGLSKDDPLFWDWDPQYNAFVREACC
eukprot:TRINITY_DN16778_c0_g1_i1.p4 TRINITY_DN16778_c0_g1~~TRINITY_DN16778_c0_g1_i1.p4  ORF type:complete len:123 (+),score=31.87 TRINITY_DN16778_c0_g1_i1:261-629(+)